ncbi:MAG: SusD/RagB family nutrient-binding outer membrane lipoprotein [Bacteroidales bacterium]|nr:SusD/RagB family nutrient-binding outer membrane lipoprotein [Bacteroidales bacterium]MDY6002086.1 SusD/RagB family nutrient-binding outer membrane lipoprotein [Candidatus Cryptobacteroides sp.]
MKKQLTYILFVTLSALLAASCGKFGDINKDPNKISQDNTRNLFIRACQGTTFSVMSSSPAPQLDTYNPWTQIYPQYLGEGQNIQYTGLNINQFGVATYYRLFMRNLKTIVQRNQDEATKNETFVTLFGDGNDQIGVSMTLKAYYMMTLTDALGMLPYSEALMGDEGNFTPKYDSVKDIYEALDKELNEAYAMMSPSGIHLDGDYDIIYRGDMSKWRSLNASIRMCLAIKLSDVDPETGKARFAKAFADGGIVDNASNMSYPYLAENDNANPLYDNYFVSARRDFWPTGTLVDAFLALHDPRVLSYAKPNFKDSVNPITGIPWGITKDELATFKNTRNPSRLADRLIKIDAPFVMISAAKVKLMCAEAAVRGWISADANALYEDAIRLSFEEKGVAEELKNIQDDEEGWSKIQAKNALVTTVDAYLAQDAVKLTGTNAEKINKIAYQRWLNGFMQNGVEAWSDWRRLNVPALSAGHQAVSAGIQTVPYRMLYASDDTDQNRESFQEVIAAQGENEIYTRIWWDVADNK